MRTYYRLPALDVAAFYVDELDEHGQCLRHVTAAATITGARYAQHAAAHESGVPIERIVITPAKEI